MRRSCRLNARTRGAGVALVALSLFASACGGGKNNATSTAPSSNPTTSTTQATGTTDATAGVGSTTSSSLGTALTTATTRKATTATTSRVSKVVAPNSGQTSNTLHGPLTNVTSAPPTEPTPGAQPGGNLTFLKTSDVTSMDPVKMANTGNADGHPGMAVFDMLLYLRNGTVVPQTAESLTSTDAVVWTLKLQPNIKFSDGTAYDATAVKFNWARLQDPANAALRASSANQMQSMDVIDPVTLKITLKAKNAVFPLSVQLMPFIGSPAAIQQKGDQFANNPVGAGPFVVKSWVRDSNMILVRNPTYWRAPMPYLDQLTFSPIVDESQRINSFCTGQGNAARIDAVGNADQADKQGCGVLMPLGLNGGLGLEFNLTRAPTSDLRTRMAVAMAIEPNDYSKVVNAGLIPFATSPFRPDAPFFDTTAVQPKYDPVKAQELFDAVAAANGGTVELPILLLPQTDYQNNGNYLAGVLNKFKNVHATVTTKAATAFSSDAVTHAFPGMLIRPATFDDPDPTFTSSLQCGGSTNVPAYCNADFDKAVADSKNQLDPAKRLSALKTAVKIYETDLPELWLRNAFQFNIIAKNVQDFIYINDGAVLLDRVWIKR